ncbi:putative CDP-diacylglycerol--glycerol-3-phosphate 3-phosphatidyl-transferase 1 [bacterium MnTg03]|nr:putative CDP-diacylglycerol--glycerol-3-phosphate 3-phosphatidyl-transferase 1 [bacterium MnTg03]
MPIRTFNLPNLVSSIRVGLAPVLVYFAINQMEAWFLGVLLFSGFTDILDGFLARTLNQITALGAHLDSWGDFAIYSTMAICAWILWPEIVEREMPYFAMIIASFSIPIAIGLIKFRGLTSYHTWSVKVAVAVTFTGYVLLFAELAQWPFVLASLACVYAGIEQILITLTMNRERVNVSSIWAAMKYEQLVDD